MVLVLVLSNNIWKLAFQPEFLCSTIPSNMSLQSKAGTYTRLEWGWFSLWLLLNRNSFQLLAWSCSSKKGRGQHGQMSGSNQGGLKSMWHVDQWNTGKKEEAVVILELQVKIKFPSWGKKKKLHYKVTNPRIKAKLKEKNKIHWLEKLGKHDWF